MGTQLLSSSQLLKMSSSTDSQSLSRPSKLLLPIKMKIGSHTVKMLVRFLITPLEPEKNSKLIQNSRTSTEKWLPRLLKDFSHPLKLEPSTIKIFYSASMKLMVLLWSLKALLKLSSKLTKTRTSKKPSAELLKHLDSFKNSRKPSQSANQLSHPTWTGLCSTKLSQLSRTQSSISMSLPRILS